MEPHCRCGANEARAIAAGHWLSRLDRTHAAQYLVNELALLCVLAIAGWIPSC